MPDTHSMGTIGKKEVAIVGVAEVEGTAKLARAAKIVADNDDDVGWIIEIVVHFQTSVCRI